MSKLPIISAKDLIKILEVLDYRIKSQKGSHIKLSRTTTEGERIIIVPNHKSIKKGTLKNIIRYLNIDSERLIELLKN